VDDSERVSEQDLVARATNNGGAHHRTIGASRREAIPVSDEPRIIKKYPNRRLYDTAISSYITLEDVRKLVIDEQPFVVQDAKSKDDITRTILLQIILEQEEDGNPIFTQEVLRRMICFYGDSMQGMITSYFERSMQLFVEQQSRMREQMQSVMTTDPLALVREMTDHNLGVWKEMQRTFLRAASPRAKGAGSTSADRGSDRSPGGDVGGEG
jgi:polyhydroxyalkanoate synthesis repressor PhaR